MSLDTSPLGEYVAAMTATLADDYPADAVIRTVGIVVEVDTGDEGKNDLLTICSDSRLWVAAAFFKEAMHQTEERIETAHPDED